MAARREYSAPLTSGFIPQWLRMFSFVPAATGRTFAETFLLMQEETVESLKNHSVMSDNALR